MKLGSNDNSYVKKRYYRNVVQNPSSFALRHKKNDKSYVKPILAMITVCVVLASVAGYIVYTKPSLPTKQIKENLGESKSNTPVRPAVQRTETWWNDEYRYYFRIGIQNNSLTSLMKKGSVVKTTFNHAKLFLQGKSLIDGKDIVVVYLDKSSKFQSVNFILENTDTEKTNLVFALADDIQTNEINNYYYVYYGSSSQALNTSLANKSNEITSGYQISNSPEFKHPLDLALSRKWILRDSTIADPKFTKSEIRLNSTLKETIQNCAANVYENNGRLVKTMSMARESDSVFVSSLEVGDLPVGTYEVQVTATTGIKDEISPRQKFFISKPLYVNWSIDWEGDPVDERWLNAVDRISTEFNVPITHYFNPRIYIAGMSSDRAKYLTNWVLQRKKNKGDEIGLHLHMWYDMVKAIGITDKHDPNWSGGATGHDVPETAYSAEDFDKMIKWAKNQFSQNGLPAPILYRAGGWQMNIDQLKVLVQNGIKVDSSGRDFIRFGTKQMPVPWNLYPTTKPFQPSIYDMNVTGAEHLNIWEFPNNGDNSSNYGPESKKNIEAFRLNFNGEPMRDKQTFVVLSHMQYFHNDDPVISKFFKEASQYKASEDNGPVIYTTVEKILPEYESGNR